jgi:hypothetical protein
MDLTLADKAHKLAKVGKTGPEIAKAINVRYASEAHTHAAVGAARAAREAARLSDAEVLLLRCLAADIRATEARGSTCSSKSPDVSHRARKHSGWANATASKRLGERRKGGNPRAGGTGLRLVGLTGNGHLWLTPAGWAMVHAIEGQAS